MNGEDHSGNDYDDDDDADEEDDGKDGTNKIHVFEDNVIITGRICSRNNNNNNSKAFCSPLKKQNRIIAMKHLCSLEMLGQAVLLLFLFPSLYFFSYFLFLDFFFHPVCISFFLSKSGEYTAFLNWPDFSAGGHVSSSKIDFNIFHFYDK